MIHFDCVTLFPQMFAALTESGITSRALKAARYSLELWNPRDFTSDNYRTVDDRPYGGGPGMVMLAEPLDQAIRAAKALQNPAAIREIRISQRASANMPSGIANCDLARNAQLHRWAWHT